MVLYRPVIGIMNLTEFFFTAENTENLPHRPTFAKNAKYNSASYAQNLCEPCG